jgi:DNA-directed RNA polymerase specialized sigma24 family protein
MSGDHYTLWTETVTASARPRRSGSRPASLSPAVRAALRGEAQRLADLGDPVAVIRATADTFAALDAELERIAAVRLAAVARLRTEGWSYDRIAAATGLSKGRVAQLSRAPRA